MYVESITDVVPLPAVEQLMIRHQFGQVEFASEHWFRLAATTLASVTRAAGLATPAKSHDAHIRRIDLVGINDRMASLILVLREGSIKQALITFDGDATIDQPTLNQVAALLNERLSDQTARRAAIRLSVLIEDDRIQALARRVGERVVKIVTEFDAAAIEEVFSDGLLNVMEAPEFAQSDKLRRVFSALENRAYLGELVGSVAGGGRIQIFIGHENAPLEMQDVSLVLAPYGRPGRAIGVVGVLGPTRMLYSQAIGTVRFVSGLMNELVDHLYA
jgi:heat-inducible transcriptional repressor